MVFSPWVLITLLLCELPHMSTPFEVLWNSFLHKSIYKMKLFTIAAAIASANAQIATCGQYGCSKKMDTTGCSSQTGAQDGCGSGTRRSGWKGGFQWLFKESHALEEWQKTTTIALVHIDPNSVVLEVQNPLTIAFSELSHHVNPVLEMFWPLGMVNMDGETVTVELAMVSV